MGSSSVELFSGENGLDDFEESDKEDQGIAVLKGIFFTFMKSVSFYNSNQSKPQFVW